MRTEGLGMKWILIYKNIIAGKQIWHTNENEAKVKGHGEIRVGNEDLINRLLFDRKRKGRN